MVVDGNGTNKWREKEMEGENNLRTLECFRGRLLAERVASKAAKDDAEFMENKLMELEKQLSTETELRNKAEKKLKLLMKKMKSASLVKSSTSTSSDLGEPEKQNSDLQISKLVQCSTSQEGISDSSITRLILVRIATIVFSRINQENVKRKDNVTFKRNIRDKL
ncbi:hypothetical protein C5167_045451 [Papaver somniferum]|uniref:Uncharacterized protein n=1 Tax=Papaver somniferum TaxID=3469 RepID=A0A4Y7LEM0_PAPSO|nr:hypothetical protein C5167_045451 [Papaver somniferum]